MALDEYSRKRNFTVTAEPPARVGATTTGRSFVVQKHAARQLHYDFRIELDGVLKSWSIPKGPSFDPAAKRLAVAVEDHPIDYGGFEGIIPAGQYGGGTVLLWDRGTWAPLLDPAAGLSAGHLKFELLGEKLRGRWALVRLKPRARAADGRASDERSWLLVKDRDGHARPESEWSVTDARPESVATGRDLDAIAAASDRVWHSDRGRLAPSRLTALGACVGPMPEWVRPARPKLARRVPDGDHWLHEIEIVGERVVARLNGGRVQLLGVDGRDRTAALARLASLVRTLPASQAIIDGMATALGADGHSGADRPADTLYAIDLPYLDGHDLTRIPLSERKGMLASLVSKANAGAGTAAGLRYVDHVLGRGRDTFAHASALGAAGIVSKKIDSRYPPPVSAWRIVRCSSSSATHASAQAALPNLARKAPSRVGSRPAALAAHHRGRVWEPFEGSHVGVGSRPAALAAHHRGRVWEPFEGSHVGDLPIAGVKLTHPQRMLYPDVGITKLDLARFYERVGERMLPYLVDRPLTLVRAPDGMNGQRFFVRHAGDWAPRALRQFEITGGTGTGAGTAMIVDDMRGLVALAQMNVLEIHPWNARTGDLERPDRIVFDLDPGPEVPWSDVVDGAKRVRDVLETLELASFVKTTGGKGLHVVVPLTPAATWDDTLEFSRVLAQALARFEPARFSAGLAKAARTNKIFVDYLRNRRGATSVSVFSSRAQATATVSVPVAWEALGFATRADAFHVGDVDRWFEGPDPWAEHCKIRQRLTATKIKAARAALGRAP
jgi:bifunctional non-homologous end joining protein LigD